MNNTDDLFMIHFVGWANNRRIIPAMYHRFSEQNSLGFEFSVFLSSRLSVLPKQESPVWPILPKAERKKKMSPPPAQGITIKWETNSLTQNFFNLSSPSRFILQQYHILYLRIIFELYILATNYFVLYS